MQKLIGVTLLGAGLFLLASGVALIIIIKLLPILFAVGIVTLLYLGGKSLADNHTEENK